MLVAAMAFICWPMLRMASPSRTELDSEQTLYSARISEIEKDLEIGRLDAVSAEAAKAEEARRLIKSSENSQVLVVTKLNKPLLIVSAVFLPALSLPLYFDLGTPQVASTSAVASVQPSQQTQPTMQELLAIAEKRLVENPDDINGWKAVGPVYLRMGRFKDAETAFKNIMRVEGRSPEFMIKLADVYIEEKQGQVDDRAKSLINEVLSVDPENSNAKFYSGIVALQNDNEDETLRIWQGMLDNAKGDEEWLPVIRARVQELKTLQSAPAIPVPDANALAAAEEMSVEERNDMVEQMVAGLADRLEQSPDDKQGWERLIRAYIVLNRKEDALAALGRASEQFADDQDYISALQTLIPGGLQNQGDG